MERPHSQSKQLLPLRDRCLQCSNPRAQFQQGLGPRDDHLQPQAPFATLVTRNPQFLTYKRQSPNYQLPRNISGLGARTLQYQWQSAGGQTGETGFRSCPVRPSTQHNHALWEHRKGLLPAIIHHHRLMEAYTGPQMSTERRICQWLSGPTEYALAAVTSLLLDAGST